MQKIDFARYPCYCVICTGRFPLMHVTYIGGTEYDEFTGQVLCILDRRIGYNTSIGEYGP